MLRGFLAIGSGELRVVCGAGRLAHRDAGVLAMVATEQLRVAGDAAAQKARRRIARDPARHAELAWRFVRWALVREPSAATAVASAFARASRRVADAARADERTATPADAAAWSHHGRLASAELAATKRRALAEIVAPCAEALLCAAPPRLSGA
ncbi:MAG: hypothetical protein WKG00_09900 [Polyangiaceae bacterium]